MSAPIPSALTQPELAIIEHGSLGVMQHAKNGVQKQVHVVVKNTPFFITVGFANNSNKALNFNAITAEALLMYDCEEDRFIDFVRNKPIEYKGTMSPAGDSMKFEIRLKKLSSQLEDMFFKIRFQCRNTDTKEELTPLVVTSLPIKVVSKPEQVARITGSPELKAAQKKAPRGAKKRTHNEMMYDTIQRMEQQQEEQKQLLQQLLAQQAGPTFPVFPVPKSVPMAAKAKDSASGIEQAIHNLVSAFEAVPAAERPLKMRRIAEALPAAAASTLFEISGHLQCNLKSPSALQGAWATQDLAAPSALDVTSDLLADDFYTDFLSGSFESF